MHSSISSSDQVPRGAWGRTWLLTLTLVALSVGGWETLWRMRGFEPSLRNDIDAWIAARSKVQEDSVLLLGTSRIMTDLNPTVLAAELGVPKPVQLGIHGSSPVPLLEELAEDEDFSGTVIVDLVPRFAFDASGKGERLTLEYMRAFREAQSSPSQRLENRLLHLVQRFFVFFKSSLAPKKVLKSLWQGSLPKDRLVMDQDRFLRVDFGDAYAAQRPRPPVAIAQEPVGPEGRNFVLARIGRAVTRIRNRRGTVIFVRLPVTGPTGKDEQEKFPRHVFWDPLAKHAPVPTLHWKDFRELSGFRCPDDSHLDKRDSTVFTRRFAKILRKHLSSR